MAWWGRPGPGEGPSGCNLISPPPAGHRFPLENPNTGPVSKGQRAGPGGMADSAPPGTGACMTTPKKGDTGKTLFFTFFLSDAKMATHWKRHERLRGMSPAQRAWRPPFSTLRPRPRPTILLHKLVRGPARGLRARPPFTSLQTLKSENTDINLTPACHHGRDSLHLRWGSMCSREQWGAGEDSGESLGLQGDPTSPS